RFHEPTSDDDKLVIGKATAKDQKKLEPLAQIAKGFAGKAPLWAYILSEAQVTSWQKADAGAPFDDIPIKLGPVGGRIVAGVFAALLRGDPTSYLGTDHLRGGAPFTPITDFTRNGEFRLAQLINVALWPPPGRRSPPPPGRVRRPLTGRYRRRPRSRACRTRRPPQRRRHSGRTVTTRLTAVP